MKKEQKTIYKYLIFVRCELFENLNVQVNNQF